MPRALADALHNAQLLLVVDNCEHVLDACASLVDLLLRECQTLHDFGHEPRADRHTGRSQLGDSTTYNAAMRL